MLTFGKTVASSRSFFDSGIIRDFAAYGNTNAANLTFVNQIPVPYEYDAVQLIYANYDFSATMTIGAASIASAPTNLNNGSALSWTTVTFNDAGTMVIPIAEGGAALDEVCPGILVSDIMSLASVARTDDSTKYRLLQVRSYFSAATKQAKLFNTTYMGYMNGLYPKAQYASASYLNDFATAPAGTSKAPSASGNMLVPVAVRFFGANKVVTLTSFGDSLTAGQYSTDVSGTNEFDHNGWVMRATKSLLDSGSNVVCNNWGAYGQQHDKSMKSARKFAAQQGTDYITLFALSPNDGDPTEAGALARWNDFLYTVDIMSSRGIKVIGCTSPPFGATTIAGDVWRVAQNNKMRTLAANRKILLADFDAAIADNTTSPPSILSQYNQDNTHPNDAGHALMAQKVVPLIR